MSEEQTPRLVYFFETRQIRRNNQTIRWYRGHSFPYDPEMAEMMKIGNCAFLDDVAESQKVPEARLPPTPNQFRWATPEEAAADAVKPATPMPAPVAALPEQASDVGRTGEQPAEEGRRIYPRRPPITLKSVATS